MQGAAIEQVILRAMANANRARDAAAQLDVSSDAPIFGPDGPLDSLGLVALLMDIEDALAEVGVEVNVSDARAMSASESPFRDVPSLVRHIQRLAESAA